VVYTYTLIIHFFTLHFFFFTVQYSTYSANNDFEFRGSGDHRREVTVQAQRPPVC
jgi:hypothetical protein